MKICIICKKEKKLIEFNRDCSRKDGHNNKCKYCHRKASMEYHFKNRNKILERNKKYYLNNKIQHVINNKKWDKENKIKRSANYKVSNSIRNGKIIKPDKCQVCGIMLEKRKIHAHHFDYSKKLDVIWCCNNCHKSFHFKNKYNIDVGNIYNNKSI